MMTVINFKVLNSEGRELEDRIAANKSLLLEEIA